MDYRNISKAAICNESKYRQQTQIQKHQTNRHARIGFTGFDRTKNSHQFA
jgi:hypothetical protein